jgi:serine/threonine protein kinase
MEYVEGIDLQRLVRTRGPLPVAMACDFIQQVCAGLQHAHERGMIHRDIKPPNLLLTRTGVVKILDMGLARLERLDEGHELSSSLLTEDGAILGTPDYISPEQALDPHSVDIRADIYSLGCTLYFLLTGRAPFVGGTLLQKLMWHQSADIPAISLVQLEVPDALDKVFFRMVAKLPANRFQTPIQVHEAVAPFARPVATGSITEFLALPTPAEFVTPGELVTVSAATGPVREIPSTSSQLETPPRKPGVDLSAPVFLGPPAPAKTDPPECAPDDKETAFIPNQWRQASATPWASVFLGTVHWFLHFFWEGTGFAVQKKAKKTGAGLHLTSKAETRLLYEQLESAGPKPRISYTKGEEPIPGYQLIKFLGRGRVGEVWKASAPGGKQIAIKIIDPGERQRLTHFGYLRRVKNLDHVNLVPIFAFWLKDASGGILGENTEEPDSIFLKSQGIELIIAMGLGEMSLYDRLHKCVDKGLFGIPTEELLGYMEGAAKAIDYLNESRGVQESGKRFKAAIVHCGIKPQNILIAGGCAQVCDFVLGPEDHIHEGSSCAYMAPELLFDNVERHSTDQYSLAISYYELRCGQLPLTGTNMYEIFRDKSKGLLDFSRVQDQEQAVLKKATAVDPNERYASTLEMVRQLRGAVKGS